MRFFLLFPVFLFAMNFDFSPCFKKYKNIYSSIPITNSKSVTFSKPTKYIFYDPFTKMYVVSAKNKKVIDFYDNPKLGWFMAAINFDSVYGGTFAKDMLFLYPAKLSTHTPKNTIISDIFCRAYGVGSGVGFIKSSFVKHFAKFGYWGDIGIEVDRFMKVKYVDPFYVQGIKPGERIVFINGKNANVKTFSKYVLLGKIGDEVKITTNNRSFLVKIRKKIYNFTPLMHFDIVVDKNLIVTKVSKKIYNKTYLTPPARLIAVNGKKIHSFSDLKKALSFDKNVTITLEKDGIKINIPVGQ